ncbi:hypothetical protein EIP91_007659 [Steccherinum ochraceum]|uniref:Rhamnogalacturonase A/B/Epimerase-like pectate lyase domain-containing protein n=1 Tax=Steccherinum ochraceum TaxID=92696 RepID=A0A4R0R6M7_9APHY|nr:hypothetical protein EIP91_007659 [Steccherinum ochraceum]
MFGLSTQKLFLLGPAVLWCLTPVLALGTSCSAPVTRGTASPNDAFWFANIQHQGTAAFNSNPGSYQVFRNVKNFGAVGDGNADDTAAINNAISSGGRCSGFNGCGSTSTSPAVIYFPPGTYKVSTPILALYQSQLIGDARHPPTLLASPNFSGFAVIARPDGNPGYGSTNNFFRSVRNFVIDLRQATGGATGLHWQVAQATSLINIVFQMSTAPGNQHQGIYMEDGSGGFMGDLVFNGGKLGAWVGNQQFTVRNVTFNNVQTDPLSAIYSSWNWAWTYQGVTINNCQIGFDLATAGDFTSQAVGALAIVDAVVTDTPIFIRNSQASQGVLHGSLVLSNAKLTNVPTAVGVVGGATVLAGTTGTTTIASWVQGNVYSGNNPSKRYIQNNIGTIQKASNVLDSSGRIFGKSHPQYADYAVDQFISVKSQGAKGDGHTDDTQAIKNVLAKYAGCKIIFFDAGVYVVSSTITIPAGTQIVGEAWSVIMGAGNAFTDYNNPQVVVRVGDLGSVGITEITDMLFSVRGPAAGAIVVEWNVHEPAGQQGGAGTWDTHIILGGTAGSNLQNTQCQKLRDNGNNCFAAFMALHLTPQSSAYLEGMWAWLADHDLDAGPSGPQISIYSGRGIMSESQGPVWLIGTGSEHHIQYQYYLNGAQNHYIGLAQTESPYFQPSPVSPAPFILNTQYKDPAVGPGSAWALTVTNSQNSFVFGAGFYSFFSNYETSVCEPNFNCQSQLINVDSSSSIGIYSLSTVASTWMLSVNSNGIVNNADNRNGFQQTMTAWTR